MDTKKEEKTSEKTDYSSYYPIYVFDKELIEDKYLTLLLNKDLDDTLKSFYETHKPNLKLQINTLIAKSKIDETYLKNIVYLTVDDLFYEDAYCLPKRNNNQNINPVILTNKELDVLKTLKDNHQKINKDIFINYRNLKTYFNLNLLNEIEMFTPLFYEFRYLRYYGADISLNLCLSVSVWKWQDDVLISNDHKLPVLMIKFEKTKNGIVAYILNWYNNNEFVLLSKNVLQKLFLCLDLFLIDKSNIVNDGWKQTMFSDFFNLSLLNPTLFNKIMLTSFKQNQKIQLFLKNIN